MSEPAKSPTPDIAEPCPWKQCPDDVVDGRKYSVDETNPSIATKTGSGCGNDYTTIISDTPLPLNKVTSWTIKILESQKGYSGKFMYIGVAPSSINQNDDNYNKCGWYLYCFNSTLCSGPPHKYYNKSYGFRRGEGKYVRTEDSIGVTIDTKNGELSFTLNGINYGLAYSGIPLDKPLVPCVILGSKGDSIEHISTQLKENVDYSIEPPSGIKTKCDSWGTITFTWNSAGAGSIYQVEIDGSVQYITKETTFTKACLLPYTVHIFRVRLVREASVSKWCNSIGERTKASNFSLCVWKEFPKGIGNDRKYTLDKKNPRIVTKTGSVCHNCTIIGNTPFPLKKVSSWDIKILETGGNGSYIFLGVAPIDIDQNRDNRYTTGWYFDCYESKLHSGPPHNYKKKEYGPVKECGDYVHIDDSVGVIMDTTKGELSFVLEGENFGVAYEGIPLDKPLVPCAIILFNDDSVELIPYGDEKEPGGKCVIS